MNNMMNITEGYDFDDLLLIPISSEVNSRSQVSLAVDLPCIHLDIPIIASPMKGITSPLLVAEISHLGGIGILHRFEPDDEVILKDIFYCLKQCKYGNFGVAVGLGEMKRVRMALGGGAKILCIDVANGYLDSVKKFVNEVREYRNREGYCCLIMAGNVVTRDGVISLRDAGADIVRVGIGSGQLCTTRNYTGVGFPSLTAINNCNIIDYIVADGGMRNSGDIVKAIASGADLVMIGSLFGQAKESSHNGVIFGMASRMLQEEYYHSVKSVEGIEKTIEKTKTLKEIIDELTWGMKSAFTYLNARNIKELKENATFVKVGRGSIKNL